MPNAARLSLVLALPIVFGLAFSALPLGCGASSTAVGGNGSGNDAGAGDDGSATDDAGDPDSAAQDDAGADPLNFAATCTSGKMWTGGDRGSQSMHPGVACIACHSTRRAPAFTIAGTVFPTGHEPDNCNGESGATTGLQVIVTDANGKTIPIAVNTVGNFYYQGAVATPFTAKITANGGKERAMSASQTSGDCNSCHTQNGTNGAPGRITAPF